MLNYFPDNLHIKISNIVRDKLETSLINISPLGIGEGNVAYKLNTAKGNYFIKIFKSATWPEEGKLEWLENKLSEENIKHPKLLYISRDSNMFKFGFALFEYLDGNNFSNLILEKKIDTTSVLKLLSQIVPKLHTITLPQFGFISNGVGSHSNYTKYKCLEMDYKYSKIKNSEMIPENTYLKVKSYVSTCLNDNNEIIKPVLTHGDLEAENIMLCKDGSVALLDWDNAMSECWLRDYAKIFYWTRNFETKGYYKTYAYNDTLSRCYLKDIDQSSWDCLLKAMLITHCLGLVSYYLDYVSNTKRLTKTLGVFNELVRNI